MPEDLDKLIAATRGAVMTADEQERQRRSFAFGNVNIANELVTREMIERAAVALRSAED